jgi:hypothetical protein
MSKEYICKELNYRFVIGDIGETPDKLVVVPTPRPDKRYFEAKVADNFLGSVGTLPQHMNVVERAETAVFVEENYNKFCIPEQSLLKLSSRLKKALLFVKDNKKQAFRSDEARALFQEKYWNIFDWIRAQENPISASIPLILIGSDNQNALLKFSLEVAIDAIESYQLMFPEFADNPVTFYINFGRLTDNFFADLLDGYQKLWNGKVEYTNQPVDQVKKWMLRQKIPESLVAELTGIDRGNLNRRMRKRDISVKKGKPSKWKRDTMLKFAFALELSQLELEAFLAYEGYVVNPYDARDHAMLKAFKQIKASRRYVFGSGYDFVSAINKELEKQGFETL